MTTITATYTGPRIPIDPYWIRMDQVEVADDVATLAETAQLLDSLYQIEACNPVTAVDPQPAEEQPDEDTVVENAANAFDLAICAIDPDGSVEVQLKIYRSHQADPYRLHVAGGSVVSTERVQEQAIVQATVTESTDTTLESPVIGEVSIAWMADAIASGNPPTINRIGNTLYWSIPVTGSIRAEILTVYDLVTIRVDGVDGEPGQATVRVVYHGLVDDLDPQLPEPSTTDRSLCPRTRWEITRDDDRVTCYKDIVVSTKCACSHEEIDYRTVPQVVPCPDWVKQCPGNLTECMILLGTESVDEYVDCAADNEISGRPGAVHAVSDPDYYQSVCCKPSPGNLPQCVERRTSYRGGAAITGGEAIYRNLYGPATRFVPVSPKGGVCGQHITRQIIDSSNCCEGVPELAIVSAESVAVMAPGADGLIVVSGGRPPYRWTIGGTGMSFYGGSDTAETMEPMVWIHAASFACGWAPITVTDGCSTLVYGVRITQGAWVELGSFAWTSSGLYLIGSLLAQCNNQVLSDATYLGYTEDGSKSQLSADNRYWMGGGTALPANNPMVPGSVGVPFQYGGAYVTYAVPEGAGCLDGCSPPDPIIGVFSPILATGCMSQAGRVYSRTPTSAIYIYQWGC